MTFRQRIDRALTRGQSIVNPHRATPRHNRAADESGAVLVLALVFLIAVSLIVTGLLTFVGTSLRDTSAFSNERNVESPPEAAPSDPRTAYPSVLTAAELAEIMRVDRRVIYDMVRDHQIPGVRPFRRQLRFDRDIVLNWLRDGQGRASRSSGRSTKHER